MIAPGGKIIYGHKGPADIMDVRHAVLSIFPDSPAFPGQAQYWAKYAPR